VEATAIILAGGKSTRFGSDKAAALLGGRPLLHRVVDAASEVCGNIIVVRAAGQRLPDIRHDVRVMEDEYEALGPLAGMITAFEAGSDAPSLVLSCDAPLVRPALLRAMLEALPGHGAVCGLLEQRAQPLPGAYDASRCLPLFRTRVERGDLAVHAALAEVDTLMWDEARLRQYDPSLLSFLGVNTPDDLARAGDALSALATAN
jgi:molybdopterin-guanine dinucleotide biosynthesis protein A